MTPNPRQKTWLITGASRGLGRAMAEEALAQGDRVVVAGRDRDALIQIFGPDSAQLASVSLDVAQLDQAPGAVQTALDHFGRIDVLVNNAGYGYLTLFEESDPKAIQAQFDTNVFGLMAVTKAVLPVMRGQKSGHIFNLSSIGGLSGGASSSLYSASKFAVEGFSESIASEVARFGIKVTLIEPGFFRTDFLDAKSVQYAPPSIPDYAEAAQAVRAFFDGRSHNQAGDPAKLAKAVFSLSRAAQPPLRVAMGTDAVAVVEAKIASLSQDLAAWRTLSLSTDGDFTFRPEGDVKSDWG